jgi:hypothetical protein
MTERKAGTEIRRRFLTILGIGEGFHRSKPVFIFIFLLY